MLREAWPQLTWVVLVLIGLIVSLLEHGEIVRRNFWTTLIATILSVVLLYHGGFFEPLLKYL